MPIPNHLVVLSSWEDVHPAASCHGKFINNTLQKVYQSFRRTKGVNFLTSHSGGFPELYYCTLLFRRMSYTPEVFSPI